MRANLLAPLYLSVSWILTVSYQLFTETAVKSIANFPTSSAIYSVFFVIEYRGQFSGVRNRSGLDDINQRQANDHAKNVCDTHLEIGAKDD